MQLDSARHLKTLVSTTILAPLTAGGEAVTRSLAVSATAIDKLPDTHPSIAVGLAPRKRNQYHLAIRCQREELMGGKEMEQITKKAKGEIDVRFIGRLRKREAVPWYRTRVRPLQIGVSCGHFKITAGTLGCFVKLKSDAAGKIHILSNNHVLANENRAKKGDVILQPGHFDGGANPIDAVATLTKFVRLKKNTANQVDCAIAELAPGQEAELRAIKGLGKLAGVGPDFIDEGTTVAKLGRTTGLTRGRVTAFELDNVVVQYDAGNLRFDNQIEVEGADDDAFSAGGDSGSVIAEESTRLAIALLFAGGDVGGSNGKGLTYANPIHPVLDALKIELA